MLCTGVIQVVWEIAHFFNRCCLNSVDACMENVTQLHCRRWHEGNRAVTILNALCPSAYNN